MVTDPYAESARLAKAFKLADAFARFCQANANADGEPNPTAQAVLEMALAVRRSAWDDLATICGVRKPSDRTVELIITMLQNRADLEGTDPFDGFAQ